MNEKTFALLEFDRLREEIGAYCLSPEGRAEFLRRVPSADEAQVEAWKDSARAWNFALDGESPPPFRSWPEVLPVFAVLRAEGAVLAAEELTALGDFCRAAESMRRWGQENAPDRAAAPEGTESVMPESADPVPSGEKSRRKETLALFQTAAELPDLSAACSAVSSVFEPDGTFRELPRLAAIRAEITAIRRDIEKRTARFFSNPALASMLQSLLPALRNGRQVLAVKANFRGRIRGIVHEVSQTGQTVYVEPEEIVERNNDLIAEEFRLSREMAEIRRELTESLRGYCPAFQDAFRCMTVFDGLHAAALWGRKRGCVFARLPSASGDSGEFFLRLVRARHPFLRGEVVPVDLSIPRNTRAVILTGPNTGGKTVTLKTAALFALANQCGWPVPAAEGTLLPVFDFVGCDIGDDQSIEQSLSTFSAHMKTVSGFFAHAGERSLILLDEFGSGTDPQEGAAIAMAVLDALLQRGSLLLITTHHGAIKHYGYSHAGCVNASVEFNAETLSPTYRILMGIPGESRALDIAARNGLPPEILAAARAYLAGGDADVSALIQGLTEKHRELRGLEDRLHTLEDLADDMALGKLLPQDGQIPDGLLRKHEEANRLLFLSTWSNSAWNAIDKQQAAAFLTSELLPENDLCLLVSAVTMSLLECFDAAKCLWMLEAARHRKTSVEQRALTGLVLVLLRHGNRISLYYPQLTETFQLYQEEYNLKKQLNRICLQLLRSRDTEKIDRKMREEIIPEVMKNVDFLRKMKFESDEPEENDWNPDWTNAFEKNGLGDKIREINELQMAGSDVYMSTFSMLKGFPFFNEISNWFLPFDRHHSTIIQSLKNLPESDKAASLILDAGLFCDSDKYSMAFTLAQLPKGQRGLMMQQFNNRGLEEIIDEQQFGHIRQHAARPEIISNQYIHDLYRFFKLFRRKNEFKDPFREDMNPYHNPILRTLMTTAEDIQPIADYFFQNNYLEEALELYREQASVEGTPDIYQKIGYCLQKGKRYREAIESYQTADALYPNQAWTLRHLGTCHRMLKDYSAALEYYQKADALQPDNYHILFHIGTSLAGM